MDIPADKDTLPNLNTDHRREPVLLSTDEAVTYLKETYNFPTTRKSLEVLRNRGGGPAFSKIGRRVFYTPETLDAWLASSSQVVNSTSEYKAA